MKFTIFRTMNLATLLMFFAVLANTGSAATLEFELHSEIEGDVIVCSSIGTECSPPSEVLNIRGKQNSVLVYSNYQFGFEYYLQDSLGPITSLRKFDVKPPASISVPIQNAIFLLLGSFISLLGPEIIRAFFSRSAHRAALKRMRLIVDDMPPDDWKKENKDSLIAQFQTSGIGSFEISRVMAKHKTLSSKINAGTMKTTEARQQLSSYVTETL